ncbi:MAG: zinc ribbon domain-containing protein [Oscillochloris sp.]|nr:zinc ribbon domain-containing protein [Oscillochloris sp.]
MPMYEYGCQSCNSRFDLLRRMDQDDTGITCPVCHSESVQRRLSVFASYSKGAGMSSAVEAPMPSSGGVSCGRGCPGCACGPRS